MSPHRGSCVYGREASPGGKVEQNSGEFSCSCWAASSWQKGSGLRSPLHASLSVCVCVCVLVTQSCPTLCDHIDCSPPGSSVHGILQARILEWAAISFSLDNYSSFGGVGGGTVRELCISLRDPPTVDGFGNPAKQASQELWSLFSHCLLRSGIWRPTAACSLPPPKPAAFGVSPGPASVSPVPEPCMWPLVS